MGPMDKDRAQFTGEIERLGALVVERYLGDVQERLGKQLKLLCRAECLPVLSRVTWELGISSEWAMCMMCEKNQVETIEHLLLVCPAYHKHRQEMKNTVATAY